MPFCRYGVKHNHIIFTKINSRVAQKITAPPPRFKKKQTKVRNKPIQVHLKKIRILWKSSFLSLNLIPSVKLLYILC